MSTIYLYGSDRLAFINELHISYFKDKMSLFYAKVRFHPRNYFDIMIYIYENILTSRAPRLIVGAVCDSITPLLFFYTLTTGWAE